MSPRLAALTVAAMLAVPWAGRRVDGTLGEFRGQERTFTVWTGKGIRRVAPGFENIMADLYWIRTVQYFGSQRAFDKEKRFDLLRPLIEITTDLDPRLTIAYRYGAIFLCEKWPTGAGRPEDGIAILEKGVRANPSDWRLRQDLGYFTFVYLHDAKRASGILIAASRLPGAPFWLATLAAKVVSTDDRAAGREIWHRLYDQSEQGVLRENAAIHLMNLAALDEVDALNAAASAFEKRTGRKPASLEELVAASGLRAVDPAGTPFRYDAAKGTVSLDMKSRAWIS